jgi:hypothetical protein
LVIDPEILKERERQNTEFLKRSSDPERMFQMFMGRSLWYNDFIKQNAASLGLDVLHQNGDSSPDDLIERILQAID